MVALFLFVSMKRILGNQMAPTIVMSRRIPGLSERALAAFVAKAGRAAGLHGAATVLVGSNRRMRDLNARFRGKNYATDVLSFPPASFVEGFAGDVAVSLDIAARNARSLGHSVADEVKILVLHGLLHLAGYDHETDSGDMAAKEVILRRKLGLPAALIERAPASARRVARRSRLRR